MVMVGADSGSLYRRTHSLSRLAWSWVGGRLVPFYIHQNEQGELSQWLCHDDSPSRSTSMNFVHVGDVNGWCRGRCWHSLA